MSQLPPLLWFLNDGAFKTGYEIFYFCFVFCFEFTTTFTIIYIEFQSGQASNKIFLLPLDYVVHYQDLCQYFKALMLHQL